MVSRWVERTPLRHAREGFRRHDPASGEGRAAAARPARRRARRRPRTGRPSAARVPRGGLPALPQGARAAAGDGQARWRPSPISVLRRLQGRVRGLPPLGRRATRQRPAPRRVPPPQLAGRREPRRHARAPRGAGSLQRDRGRAPDGGEEPRPDGRRGHEPARVRALPRPQCRHLERARRQRQRPLRLRLLRRGAGGVGRAASRPREDGGRGLRPVQQQPLEPHAPRRDSCPGARECSGSPANWTNQGFQPDRWSSTVQVRGKIGRWDKGGEPSRHTRFGPSRSAWSSRCSRWHPVLPGDRPLDSLPAPLRGTAQAGEIVAEALAPTREETPEAAPDTPQDSPASSTLPPAASSAIPRRPARPARGPGAEDPDRPGGGSTTGRPGTPPPAPRRPPPKEPKPPKPPRDAPKPGKPDRETRKEAPQGEGGGAREAEREARRAARGEEAGPPRTRRTTAAAGTDAGRQPRLARLTP